LAIVVTDQLVFLLTAIVLIFLGIGSMTYSKNLIKTVMSFQVAVIGANLALFASGLGPQNSSISDSFVLFSIASGASIEAVGLAIVVAVYRKYGTLNPSEIRRLRG
jgi:NADH:ubiquinone oxidoreductase subunit K